MIGSRFWLDVGSHTEKLVKFLVVDPECPTIRNASNWMTCQSRFLKYHLRLRTVDKVLVTETDPVKLVVIYITYPCFHATYVQFSSEQFRDFRYRVCVPGIWRVEKVNFNWLKEGF